MPDLNSEDSLVPEALPKHLSKVQEDALAEFVLSRLDRFDPEECFYIPTKDVPANVVLLTNAGTTQMTDPVAFYRHWLTEIMGESLPEYIDGLVEKFKSEGWVLEPAKKYGVVMTKEDPNEVEDLTTLPVACIPKESELVLVQYVD